MSKISKQIECDGYALIEDAVSTDELEKLRSFFSTDILLKQAGIRNLFKLHCFFKEIALNNELLKIIRPILGRQPIAVRATLFDKGEVNSWRVRWHQDKTIAVKKHISCEGYHGESIKNEIPHVQGPTSLLARMLSARFHLDDAKIDSGGLKVCPGSHRLGKISSTRISNLVNENRVVNAEAKAGDILLMRPLLLHSSEKTSVRRRVIHIDYSQNIEPHPMQWYEKVA